MPITVQHGPGPKGVAIPSLMSGLVRRYKEERARQDQFDMQAAGFDHASTMQAAGFDHASTMQQAGFEHATTRQEDQQAHVIDMQDRSFGEARILRQEGREHDAAMVERRADEAYEQWQKQQGYIYSQAQEEERRKLRELMDSIQNDPQVPPEHKQSAYEQARRKMMTMNPSEKFVDKQKDFGLRVYYPDGPDGQGYTKGDDGVWRPLLDPTKQEIIRQKGLARKAQAKEAEDSAKAIGKLEDDRAEALLNLAINPPRQFGAKEGKIDQAEATRQRKLINEHYDRRLQRITGEVAAPPPDDPEDYKRKLWAAGEGAFAVSPGTSEPEQGLEFGDPGHLMPGDVGFVPDEDWEAKLKDLEEYKEDMPAAVYETMKAEIQKRIDEQKQEAAPFVPPAAKMELADLEAVAAPAVKEKATISQLFDEAFKSESPSMERIKGLLQKLSPKVAKAVEYVIHKSGRSAQIHAILRHKRERLRAGSRYQQKVDARQGRFDWRGAGERVEQGGHRRAW